MEELKQIPWFGWIVVFLVVLFISYFLLRATKNHLANRYEAGFSWVDKNALAKWIGKYIPFLDEKSVTVSVAKYWDETLVVVLAIYVATHTSLSVFVEDYAFLGGCGSGF